MKTKKNLVSFIVVFLLSISAFAILTKHFWDVVIDNNLDVVGTIGGSGGGVAFDEFFNLEEESTPANPSANEHRQYYKSDGNLYTLDSAGIEKRIGAGGGGGSGGINLLADENSNCEDGDPPINWTASAGTFIASTDGFDVQSCSWDPSATSQTLRTTAVSIPEGLFNRSCSARIQYKWSAGSATDLTWRVEDSSDVLIVENDLEVSADWREDILFFTCPSSGDMRIEFESNADAALVLIDNVELGQVGIASLSQALLVAHTFYAATASCFPLITSTSFVDYPTDTDCPAPTVVFSTIAVDAADNDLLDLDFDDLPVGTYIIQAKAGVSLGAASLSGSLRISDGSSNGSSCGMRTPVGDTNLINPLVCDLVVTYTTSGARNFKLQGRSDSGSSQISNSSADRQEVTWTIWKVPGSNAEAITLETVGEHWDLSIGGANINLSTSSEASYIEMTDAGLDLVINPGSKSAKIACASGTASTGLTCSSNESNGIVIEPETAGRFKTCVEFSHNASANAAGFQQTAFQVVETTDTSSTIVSEGKSRITSSPSNLSTIVQAGDNALHVCGIFSFTTVGEKVFRLEYEQVTAATLNLNRVLGDRAATVGQRDIHWTVEKLDQQMPAPVFTEIKKHIDSSTESLRIEFVEDTATCSIATCAIDRFSAGVISVTRGSTGNYTLNFVSGTFSGIPTCTCTSGSAHTNNCQITGTSATTVPFLSALSTSGALTDGSFNIICIGPK